ncbi:MULTISPECIES: hypothetical protein [Mycobacteriaceae]|uniref:PASTA domain-containing protein n=1 Tax=Mycolicibacterium mucogenicum DSM 44124 TaxID=1226753 RepID=A0A8H2JG37_MYCMU|nr:MULTISPECIES: hypothetical protein [Mycobacteriaceae]KAB7755662.1 hypothetical protein MMUC44124_19490 [Mycolicibacterium mucogenicum DSM 44124]QPG68406.1 hypothetical protein C1S78_023520 [Mycolicibacterium mucogenicum DSM 44124]SEB09139.1 hypothetical protein SAMN04488580_10714 [Mycobacterium sp. 283mftsu]
MKSSTKISAGTGVVLALLIAGAAPAAAQPVVPPAPGESASQTIHRLQSEGFRVIESRVGSGSIDNCTVTAVRHGRELSSQEGKLRGQNTTVYVDLGCK